MAESFDYTGWNNAELERAQNTAHRFLTVNQAKISNALSQQCRILGGLIASLESGTLSFDERLDCLAHIADVSQMLRDSADGFFELGSQPVVARVLANAELR